MTVLNSAMQILQMLLEIPMLSIVPLDFPRQVLHSLHYLSLQVEIVFDIAMSILALKFESR